jgi:phosphoribosylanthranilate isomerase
MSHKTAPKPQVKICGVTAPEALNAAISGGARFAGFVFWPKSPRAVSADRAAPLLTLAEGRIERVGLFVDPDDSFLDSITQRCGLDLIQLHGSEDARRVQAVQARTGLPVIKAIRVAVQDDLKDVSVYEAVADWLLFDAKVEGRHGGTGTAFDWAVLKGRTFKKPWMLSGGLNAQNIGTALSILSPDAVDVSSGVEDAPGVKSPGKIAAFMAKIK